LHGGLMTHSHTAVELGKHSRVLIHHPKIAALEDSCGIARNGGDLARVAGWMSSEVRRAWHDRFVICDVIDLHAAAGTFRVFLVCSGRPKDQ